MRRDALLPFQVFSSWNGIIAIDPAVFRPPHSLRFRTVDGGGDALSECYLLCVDLWRAGLGRIAVVPRVRVGYTLEAHLGARKDTALSKWVLSDEEQAAMDTAEWIEWDERPPAQVRTFPYGQWADGVWEPPW